MNLKNKIKKKKNYNKKGDKTSQKHFIKKALSKFGGILLKLAVKHVFKFFVEEALHDHLDFIFELLRQFLGL
ncbi:hypothetical protein ACS47_13830 [Bacillus cereus]|uniref:hypothetical protein n=1 Tax=Bacillus TaxID=1386 RepID=UPI0002797ECA|nr:MULTISPECIES: hypothetical protein [Bacillus]EJP82726.1 hypothetical protein IAU_05719 [Bacillus cereus IS075]EOO82291.1 hypothetical protein IGS_05872 [Bacillus cereus IS845/00]EOO91866.1 hypothetical protein IGQ_05977 [Bacillus cereus IS195]KAB7633334.1 hypothetical protein GBN96_24220 [Bacillus sp. B4-WWTP-NA-D-NA-NA]KLA08199.1 hypothetical protein B4153_5728 [Bacillus cereus]